MCQMEQVHVPTGRLHDLTKTCKIDQPQVMQECDSETSRFHSCNENNDADTATHKKLDAKD